MASRRRPSSLLPLLSTSPPPPSPSVSIALSLCFPSTQTHTLGSRWSDFFFRLWIVFGLLGAASGFQFPANSGLHLRKKSSSICHYLSCNWRSPFAITMKRVNSKFYPLV
jgi:hypothetical protein